MSTPIINVSVTGNDIPSQQYKTIILKPNLVDDVNTLTQAMLDLHGANTKFVIKYNFTLAEDITVPANCVLEFDGGSISGDGTDKDTIIGNGTKIVWDRKTPIFGDGLHISDTGTWLVDYISTDMFADLNYDNCLRDVFNLNNANIQTIVYIGDGTYNFALETTGSTGVYILSNTEVVLNGNTTLNFNWFYTYYIFDVSNSENIYIHGKGHIQGDRWKHNDQGGEFGMGVRIYRSKNVVIDGITVSECWGDCINISAGDSSEHSCYFITLKNLNIFNGRRCGIGVTAGKNITISDCIIDGTTGYDREKGGDTTYLLGGMGIDVEPNGNDMPVENIVIENIKATNNRNSSIRLVGTSQKIINPIVRNCSVIGGNTGLDSYTIDRVVFEKCTVKNTINNSFAFDNTDYGEINNCKVICEFSYKLSVNCTNCKDIQIINCNFKGTYDSTITDYANSFLINNNTNKIRVYNSNIYTPNILLWNVKEPDFEFRKYIFEKNDITLTGFSLYGRSLIKGSTTEYVPWPSHVSYKSNVIKYDFTDDSSITTKINFGEYTNIEYNDLRIYNIKQGAEFMWIDSYTNVIGNTFSTNNNKKILVITTENEARYIKIMKNVILAGIYTNLICSWKNEIYFPIVVKENVNLGGTVDNMINVNIHVFNLTENEGFIYDRGVSSQRPSNVEAGFRFFDKTLGKPIYWNGTAWVDANGQTV